MTTTSVSGVTPLTPRSAAVIASPRSVSTRSASPVSSRMADGFDTALPARTTFR
jgi:hypothetical protein